MDIKPKFNAVLEMCLENGIRRGYQRAFKHSDNPDQETIFARQLDCIWEEIQEWFEDTTQ